MDRLWPRGLRKAELDSVQWQRELGPSDGLRKWFAHEPARWAEFQKRYFAELASKQDLWEPLLDHARRGTVTLLFSARNERYNQAVALVTFLTRRRSRTRKK